MDGEREAGKDGLSVDDADDDHGVKNRILAALQLASREGRDDVTFFVEQFKERDELELLAWMGVQGVETLGSFDIEIEKDGLARLPLVAMGTTEAGEPLKYKVIVFARLQVSSVKKRAAWSVTARIKYEDWTQVGDGGRPPLPAPRSGQAAPNVAIKWRQKYPSGKDLGLDPKYLAGFGMTCEIVFDTLRMKANDSGLVLVSGQTGSGKSEILRGVMHRYLERLLQSQSARAPGEKRNPHVLTLEDPIETLLLEHADHAHCFTNEAIDYTPRVKGVDAKNLTEVITSALRQKPALLFVGEIREDKDLRLCLEFAGTGHLVFATTHAGSLLECMQRALGACEARDPGSRAIWVPKIRAVVHLRNFDFPRSDAQDAATQQVLLPAMYVNNALAQHALVSDGLAALLPCAPVRQAREDATAPCQGDEARPARSGSPLDVKGALGRRYFAHRVHEEMLGPDGIVKKAIAALETQLERQLPRPGASQAGEDPENRQARLDQLLAVQRAWEWNLQARRPAAAGRANLEARAISADLTGE